jgi:hypothetical protein
MAIDFLEFQLCPLVKVIGLKFSRSQQDWAPPESSATSAGHTFRHTYATLLKGNGEDVKVVQELMRHANISVTLNIFAQAITQSKRDAQSRVVSLLLDKNEEQPSTEAYRTLTGPTKLWRGFASS